MPPLTFPAIPPCPAAPCTLEEFASWATQVIALLQPHSCKPLIAQSATPVEFCFAALGSKTLGQWSGSLLRISIHADHAEKSCRYDTTAARHTLLHECAHMLAPQGDGHGPAFRRICKALGIRGNATGTVAIRTPEDRFAVRLRTTGEIFRYSPTPVDISRFTFIPGRQRETLGNLECIDLNAATSESTIENTKMELSPAQIIGAEPLPEPPAGDSPHVPSFDAKAPYHQLAAWVAACIPHGSLYRQDNKFVTIHIEQNGNIKLMEMTKLRLPTWLPEQRICTFHGAPRKNAGPDEPPPVTSISPAQAELIMASDVFRDRMPELVGVSNVRMPIVSSCKRGEVDVHLPDGKVVKRHKEIYTFEPTGEGYDQRSKIYTHSTVKQDFSRTIALASARNFIVKAFSEAALDGGFMASDGSSADALNPLQSRSLGATVAAMLGQFLHHAIDSFPMIMVIANQPGSGKSFLVRTILAPVHGEVEASNYLEDDKEFRQTLNAALFDGSRYFFLDDVKSLNSPALNRFITAPRIKDRILHTQISFVKDMRMQFFTTGNRLQSTQDIARRSMPIDLFWSQDATQRIFQGVLTEELIVHPDTRALFLRAMWAMVKHWEQAGCPRYVEHAPGGAFKKFADLAVNITIHAGFANPYGPRLVDLDSGDAMSRALTEVLITIADSIAPQLGSDPHRGLSAYFRVAEIEQFAERMHKIDIIVPRGNNKRDSLGIAMRNMKGRELVDSRGRRFEVGNKRDSASSRYLFTILSEPTRDGLAPAAYATLQLALGREDPADTLPDTPHDEDPFA